MTKRQTFTANDLDRALKVARKHGMTVECTRDGTIRVIERVDPPAPPKEPENPVEARRRRLAQQRESHDQ